MRWRRSVSASSEAWNWKGRIAFGSAARADRVRVDAIIMVIGEIFIFLLSGFVSQSTRHDFFVLLITRNTRNLKMTWIQFGDDTASQSTAPRYQEWGERTGANLRALNP